MKGGKVYISKYFNFLIKKMKKYDKKATNPFTNIDYKYDNSKSIYEQTYIWVENPNKRAKY